MPPKESARAVDEGYIGRPGLQLCQVDGCTADFTYLRGYHMRYRICEYHQKVDHILNKNGEKERFCQQCGHFHPFTMFDLNKRSCRQSLSKHNERRRRNRQNATKPSGPSGASDTESEPEVDENDNNPNEVAHKASGATMSCNTALPVKRERSHGSVDDADDTPHSSNPGQPSKHGQPPSKFRAAWPGPRAASQAAARTSTGTKRRDASSRVPRHSDNGGVYADEHDVAVNPHAEQDYGGYDAGTEFPAGLAETGLPGLPGLPSLLQAAAQSQDSNSAIWQLAGSMLQQAGVDPYPSNQFGNLFGNAGVAGNDGAVAQLVAQYILSNPTLLTHLLPQLLPLLSQLGPALPQLPQMINDMHRQNIVQQAVQGAALRRQAQAALQQQLAELASPQPPPLAQLQTMMPHLPWHLLLGNSNNTPAPQPQERRPSIPMPLPSPATSLRLPEDVADWVVKRASEPGANPEVIAATVATWMATDPAAKPVTPSGDAAVHGDEVTAAATLAAALRQRISEPGNSLNAAAAAAADWAAAAAARPVRRVSELTGDAERDRRPSDPVSCFKEQPAGHGLFEAKADLDGEVEGKEDAPPIKQEAE